MSLYFTREHEWVRVEGDTAIAIAVTVEIELPFAAALCPPRFQHGAFG